VGAVGAPDHPGDSSDLYGMGCRSFTVYGKGGVVIQRMPVKLGYDDLASMDGQHPVSVVVAPPPSDDVALALLRDLIAATK
jgi:hypothetical protein